MTCVTLCALLSCDAYLHTYFNGNVQLTVLKFPERAEVFWRPGVCNGDLSCQSTGCPVQKIQKIE